MLITIHNIVFIYSFIYIFWGGGLYWCISVTYKLCMESHCVLAAFLKHAGMTISNAYFKFRRSHANYMFHPTPK